MAVLGLRFCARAFSSCGERGPLFIAVRGPLTIRPLLLRSTGSRRAGSAIVAHGPSCSAACGIFPDQGSNPCPLHWQADSQPLRHQGSPFAVFLIQLKKLMFYKPNCAECRVEKVTVYFVPIGNSPDSCRLDGCSWTSGGGRHGQAEVGPSGP